MPQFHPESPYVSGQALARLRFLADFRRQVHTGLTKGNRALYDLHFAEGSGEGLSRPERRERLRAEMEQQSFYKMWSSLLLGSQDLLWWFVGAAVDADQDRMALRLASLSNGARGSVEVHPQLKGPAYVINADVHRMPGGYMKDDDPEDLRAGALYDLPFGAGKRWKTDNRWADTVISHWQLNVLPTFRSGFPVSVHQSSNPNSTVAGNGVQRPNLVAGAKLGTSGSLYNRLNNYINTAAFTASSAYSFGDAPRTLSLRGPGYTNWDLSLFKNIPIHNRINAQFRAEAFNAFNTPLFNGPNTAFGSANFGKITSQANFPRYLQLGLHITY